MFKIENFNFKLEHTASYFFRNLNVIFPNGKLHFVRGSNGIGKSLLFRILRGIIYQQEEISGCFILNDFLHDFTQHKQIKDSFLFKKVAVVRQKYDLMLANQLSFVENLQLANLPSCPGLVGLPDHQILPHFVERFRIDQSKPVYSLSGGQRQILAILMALQRPSQILLLDEPTAALDERNATMVMAFLSDLVSSTKLIVLIICHDKELVHKYSPEGSFEMIIDEVHGARDIQFTR
jgi:ABC-type lipoprotein export system ATPase subunit